MSASLSLDTVKHHSGHRESVTSSRPRRRVLTIVALAIGFLLTGTDVSAQSSSEKPVSFKDDIQPLLNSQCVFCHVTGAENGGLNLGRRDSHASLMAASTQAPMARVTPGDPAKSYLIHKLKGTQLEAGGNGNAMPMYDPPKPFPKEQLDLVERWIREGAQKN